MEMECKTKQRKVNWVVVISLSAVGVGLLAGLGLWRLWRAASGGYDNSMDQTSLAVGSAAPDFELQALSGETVRLSQYRGQPVLLTFGTTWCPDCRDELPVLKQLQERHPELVIVMVDRKESAAVVQACVDEFAITHPVLLDTDGAVATQYQIVAIPTELFLDAEGIIRAKIIESVTWKRLRELLPSIGIEP